MSEDSYTLNSNVPFYFRNYLVIISSFPNKKIKLVYSMFGSNMHVKKKSYLSFTNR
jgi:hypothetical protein